PSMLPSSIAPEIVPNSGTGTDSLANANPSTTAPHAKLVIAATTVNAASGSGAKNSADQPAAETSAPPKYIGFRRPILSDRYPATGLATAQHAIMTEQTAAASVGARVKRCRKYVGPQSPVNDNIAPTKPPCARKISHVLR